MEHQQMDLRTQLPNEESPEQSSAESLVALDSAPSDRNTLPAAGLISYQDQELILSRLAHEGGAPLFFFLLAKAIPSENELDKTLPPTVSRVREWQYQDILRLPKVQKEEWKTACWEELELLRKRGIFELTDLPKGRRVIKNRWVFDIKSDGRKKA